MEPEPEPEPEPGAELATVLPAELLQRRNEHGRRFVLSCEGTQMNGSLLWDCAVSCPASRWTFGTGDSIARPRPCPSQSWLVHAASTRVLRRAFPSCRHARRSARQQREHARYVARPRLERPPRPASSRSSRAPSPSRQGVSQPPAPASTPSAQAPTATPRQAMKPCATRISRMRVCIAKLRRRKRKGTLGTKVWDPSRLRSRRRV